MTATGSALSRLLDFHLLQMALFRWLDIIGVVLWVGAVGFRLLVFGPALQAVSEADRERLQKEESAYTEPALFGVLVYLVILHFATWVHEAEMMSGKPLSAIGPVLPIVLTQTHFGSVWIVKLFLLSLALVLVRFKIRARDFLLLGIGLLLCLTGTLVGHAVSHSGDTAAIFSDWVHYVSVAVWAGGLFPFRRMARKGISILQGPERIGLVTAMCGAFSKWATLAVIFIIATGAYGALLHLNGHWIMDVLYGKVLLAKIAFAAAAFGLGGVSRFYVLPAFRRMRERGATAPAAEVERRFLLALKIEIGVVVATLIVAALLTQTPPPPPIQTG